MSWRDPQALNAEALDPACCAQRPVDLTVDHRRPWLPEHRTQLYFTPIYRALHFEHRLRYNQLFALRTNEYIMMLEAELAGRFMANLQRRRVSLAQHAAIGHLAREEGRHFRLFADLNRAARPDLYAHRDRLFSELPWWTDAMFRLASATARGWSFALWYVFAMEESSIGLAQEMAERPETETLGTLDPAFARTWAEHRKDELRHIETEGRLIDEALAAMPAWRRRIDAAAFKAMLRGVTTPTRGGSGVKVIRQLVREMPELADRERAMIRQTLALKHDVAYQRSLFDRALMPIAFALYDRIPELADLGRRMPGYGPA